MTWRKLSIICPGARQMSRRSEMLDAMLTGAATAVLEVVQEDSGNRDRDLCCGSRDALRQDCAEFIARVTRAYDAPLPEDLDWCGVGYDFILTRNGYCRAFAKGTATGAYGPELEAVFDRVAQEFNEVYAYPSEDGASAVVYNTGLCAAV